MFRQFANDATRRRIISRFAVIAVVLVVFYLTIYGGITLTTEIPEQFAKYSSSYTEKNKRMVFLTDDNTPVYPITHDDKALYILNGGEDDFKSYRIDPKNKEIIIEKNLVKFHLKTRAHYQLITIANKNYKHIVDNNKVTIRMIYTYQDNQTTLLEYDLQKKTAVEISSTYVSP